MDIEKLKVIDVGGAAAGAGAALLFVRAGAPVTLVEGLARPQAVGAGSGLAETGLAVLASLELGPAIEAAGTPSPAVRIVDGSGRRAERRLDVAYREYDGRRRLATTAVPPALAMCA